MGLDTTKELQMMAERFQSRGIAEYTIQLLVWSSLALLALLGNLLTLIIIFKNKQLWTSTNFLIASLAISDLAYTVCSPIPLAIPTLALSRWPFSHECCQFQGFIIIAMVAASLQTLGWTAINRFYRVVKPSMYKRIFSRKKIIGILTVTWLLAFLAPVPYMAAGHQFVFHPEKFFCYLDLQSGGVIALSTISFYIVLPTAAIFYSYARVFYTVRQHNAQMIHSHTITAEEIKITKVIAVILVGFLCCWSPIFIIDNVDYSYGHYVMPQAVYIAYSYFAQTSSTLNPFIYGILNPIFRAEYCKLLKCCYHSNQVVIISSRQSNHRVTDDIV